MLLPLQERPSGRCPLLPAHHQLPLGSLWYLVTSYPASNRALDQKLFHSSSKLCLSFTHLLPS